MFHRYDKKKKVAVKKHCVATLDLHEAAELDAMIMQVRRGEGPSKVTACIRTGSS